MSRISHKAQTQKNLLLLFFFHFESEQMNDDVLQYLIYFEKLKKQRYLYSRLFVFKFNWVSSVLSKLFNTRFREYVRMNSDSMKHVVRLISKNSIFQNKFSCMQIFVESQIKYALYRLDHDESVNEFLFIAIMWKVSKEHIFDCIKRVVETLCRLRERFIIWLDERTRIRESLQNQKRQRKFIKIVSKMNETNIVLNIKFDDKIRWLSFNQANWSRKISRRAFFQSKEEIRNRFMCSVRFQQKVHLLFVWMIKFSTRSASFFRRWSTSTFNVLLLIWSISIEWQCLYQHFICDNAL
jgi:predicted DNA-binding protein YlxM (UPF0122 family)